MFGQPPANPFGAAPGGDPIAGMASNPMFAQMMSQMMQDPQMLDQMIASNPQLAGTFCPGSIKHQYIHLVYI
jgi:ubiquilin